MTFLQSLHNLLPMTITSLSFVYVYLPVALLLYHLAPRALKPAILLVVSLVFYALARPDSFWIAVASILFDYAMIWGVIAWKQAVLRRLFLWACIAKNIAMILYFGVAARTGTPPLGLMVMCVSGIDCALDAFREDDPQPHGFIRVALYISFFPRLYAGPLSRYGEFCEGFGGTGFDKRAAALGFGRFATGAFKYAVFGRELFWLYNDLRLIPAEDATVLSAWVLVLSFMLSLYFTLSGLSDMARGVAGLFGLSLPQNFYYPYQSRSVSDFFERFNMTVGSFLKRAMLGLPILRKNSPAAAALSLLFAGILWGMWFGVQTNYMVWGAFIALFMIMERYLYPGVLEACPTLFRRVYAFSVAIAGFTIFAGETLGQSLEYFRLMFGYSGIQLINDRIRYSLSSNLAPLLLACFFATNLTSLIAGFLRRSFPRVSGIVFGVVDVGILALFTAITLGGGYV